MNEPTETIEERSIEIRGERARWYELGSDRSAPVAHFYHANGFPFGAYRGLLEALSGSLHVVGLEMRPLWPDAAEPPRWFRWHHYADDLIEALDQTQSGPVVGIGHSMGASATVFAAARRPDLFSALVLIEPAFVTRWLTAIEPVVPFALRRRMEPARGTLRKSGRWPSRDAFLGSYRGRGLFRRVEEPALQAFADAAVAPSPDGGVQLVYPRAWEAHNYMCPTSIWADLRRVTVPVIVIAGDPSIFTPRGTWQKWGRRHPEHVRHHEVGYGHLLPLEAPGRVARIVSSELGRVLRAPLRSHQPQSARPDR
ncbi:MAG: alpha/beta hydrolase [Myxococcota bacterium]